MYDMIQPTFFHNNKDAFYVVQHQTKQSMFSIRATTINQVWHREFQASKK